MENDRRKSVVARSKSLRLQHSISLHIPIDDLSYSNLNCFIDLPKQFFNLTYIDENDTQNPDSLASLQELTQGKWQIFLFGSLFNFTYHPSQMESLSQYMDKALTTQFSKLNSQEEYHSTVSVVEDLQPTENDNRALLVTVYKETPERQEMVYKGYILSWCNPIKEEEVLLPILLCRGNHTYHSYINGIISDRFNVPISKFVLTQEEFMHLSTYCLLMLDENDTHSATIGYKTSVGVIRLQFAVEHLLKLWKQIHKEDVNGVDLDDVLHFHDALDQHVESTYGISMGKAHYQHITVKPIFCIEANAQVSIFRCSRTSKSLHRE